MGLSGATIGVIVGAVLAGGIGIFTVYFTKFLEEKRTKKHTSKALLFEALANQNRLQPLANVTEILKKVEEVVRLEGCEDEIELMKKVEEEDEIINILLPSKISFDRTVYSALSDKIGLLNPKIGEKVVQYYAKIKFTEDEDDNLGLVLQKYDTTGANGYYKTSKYLDVILSRDELRKYFTNAKEAYDIGRELIKSLKEQI